MAYDQIVKPLARACRVVEPLVHLDVDPSPAKRDRRGQAGHACAHDDDAPHLAHRSLLRLTPRGWDGL